MISTPVAAAYRIWLLGFAGFAKIIRSVLTFSDNTLLISVFDAQSKPVPKAANTSNTVRLSLHLTATKNTFLTKI